MLGDTQGMLKMTLRVVSRSGSVGLPTYSLDRMQVGSAVRHHYTGAPWRWYPVRRDGQDCEPRRTRFRPEAVGALIFAADMYRYSSGYKLCWGFAVSMIPEPAKPEFMAQMTKLITYAKLAAFGVLSLLPGRIGEAFETRWHWARRAMNSGPSKEAFERSLAALDANALCLDLGANIGSISEQLAASGAHVHAFEPDAWAFGQLTERLGQKENVTLHNAAVGGQDGTLTLMRDPGFEKNQAGTSQGTSAFASLLWEEGEAETFEVELIDIRRFLRELERPVDLMKVDIEGAEVDLLEVLLDAPELAQVREMFIETHEPQMPQLRPRLKTLRRRIRTLEHPVIHLDWQ